MLKLKINYPTREEELEILRRMTQKHKPRVQKVIPPEDILKARSTVLDIYMDEKIENYIVDIVFATREPANYDLPELEDQIEYGASPRASIFLTLTSKAHAFLQHRGYVIPEDVHAVGMDVLRHRVIVTYEAEAENVSSEDVVRQIFSKIEVP